MLFTLGFCRYSSRLGQSFSSTYPSITLQATDVESIDDVVVQDEYTGKVKYIFTDGQGRGSREVLQQVWEALGKAGKPLPSAFQVSQRWRERESVVKGVGSMGLNPKPGHFVLPSPFHVS